MAERILLDVNVVLDVLEYRDGSVHASMEVIERIEEGTHEGLISAISIDTIAYVLKKRIPPAQIHQLLLQLRLVIGIASVDEAVIDSALDLGWDDLEDAMQYISALRAGCTVLLTRDLKGFRKADRNKLRVMSPEEFLRSPGAGAPSSR
jgi:predicted nucleic acid-binding protein